MSPFRRLQIGSLILAVIFVGAVCGYFWLGGWNLLDSIYMAVTTLSMVGYRDDLGPMPSELKIFTIVLILFGVSTVLYILGGLFQMMTEGEITKALGVHRLTRDIQRLKGHIVICGFGRVGEILADELRRAGQEMVVLDNQADKIAEAVSREYLALNDDATEEDALIAAGVKRARTVVITLPKDTENVFITLTARNLNPDLQIIARSSSRSTERKLIQAGANRVVLPSTAGALRMAAMITRPTTVELIELVAGQSVAEVQIDELKLLAESPLNGLSVRESEARSRYGLLLVAIRRADGTLQFNPEADTVLRGGDTFIAMGKLDDIERFRKENGL